MGFSALGAGLTALGFSVGSFLLAPAAVPLARRYGRLVLSGGGLLMALGMLGVLLGAGGVGTGSDSWPVVPGLVVAGAGLSLLVIPLVNVVMAAVPREAPAAPAGSSAPSRCSGVRWGSRLSAPSSSPGSGRTRSRRRSSAAHRW
jgi:hypothetical protein